MNNEFKCDLRPLSNELNFLLELLKAEREINVNLAENHWLKDIDWELFLQLVEHHRCYPLIYNKLKQFDEILIPPHVMQILNNEYRKNTIKMLQLSGEMEQVDKLFQKNQIRALFLKGPAIAYELFGDISLRMSKDLDILVPEKDLDEIEILLLNIGYEKEELPTVLNEIKWRYRHIAYFHPQKKIQIEIHWRLNPRSMKEPTFEELWERKQISSLTKHSISFLGKEDLFLYLIVHGARHGWFRLRWLKDIDQIVRNRVDYKKFIQLAKKYGQKHLVGQALLLSKQLFNTPLDKDVQGLTGKKCSAVLAKKAMLYIQDMVQLHVNPKPRQLEKSYKSYIFSTNSKRQKLMFIMLSFYPNSLDEKTLKLPKNIHFLYFILRPFLLAWRRIKKPVLQSKQ